MAQQFRHLRPGSGGMISAVLRHEALRYTLVGGGLAIINNIVLIGADWLGFGVIAAMAFAWLFSGTIGFALHSRITFSVAPSASGYWRFMLAAGAGVPLALGLIALLRHGLGWPMWAAAPTATLVMFAYNYAGARLSLLRRLTGR